MILFYDTETTGFYNARCPIGHPDQVSIVQLAALLTRDNGEPVMSVSVIINPEKKIPKQASDIHGITDDLAGKFGLRGNVAMALFNHLCDRADLLVAHNIKFDAKIMECASARFATSNGAAGKREFCTMVAATPIIDMPPTKKMVAAGFNKPKPPKLSECVSHFFGETLEGAHDALVDVTACSRVYFHLKALETESGK